MAVEHVDLDFGAASEPRKDGQSSTNKGKFETTKCNCATGKWARDLHFKAGGTTDPKTTGGKHLVL